VRCFLRVLPLRVSRLIPRVASFLGNSTMATPTVLVATWRDGLFVVAGTAIRQELPGRAVGGLVRDGKGGALAIVGRRSLCRRVPGGEWITLVTSESELSCCVAVGESIFVGTDDARLLRVGANGVFEPLTGFDAVAGREKWYAGSALVDGRLIGPPLGVRSITATCDAGVLLANVHVGGIPRSSDGGLTWEPTIEIDSDVHQVCAHPTRPDVVVAAAGIGLCVSKDGGSTWATCHEGLHAPYCSAVAFVGDEILVAASADHFAAQGAVYRRPIDRDVPLLPLGGGLPRWLDGIADTGCISAQGSAVAVVDRAGALYVSIDADREYLRVAERLPAPSGILIC
jgi:hypothetical protein